MLIGIGLGPGNPDLLTLAAVKALKDSRKVYVPGKTAAELVAPYAKADVMDFPMIQDEAELSKLWETNAGIVADEAGKGTVSFAVIGDPNFFSTFSHLRRTIDQIAEITKNSKIIRSGMGGEIERRLNKAAEADFAIAIYNTKSRSRRHNFEGAVEIIRKYRTDNTPVGIVKNATREGETVTATTLGRVMEYNDIIDMSTIVLIGNRESRLWDNRIITPRGYQRKYAY